MIDGIMIAYRFHTGEKQRSRFPGAADGNKYVTATIHGRESGL
jgi:hypothetical protein